MNCGFIRDILEVGSIFFDNGNEIGTVILDLREELNFS